MTICIAIQIMGIERLYLRTIHDINQWAAFNNQQSDVILSSGSSPFAALHIHLFLFLLHSAFLRRFDAIVSVYFLYVSSVSFEHFYFRIDAIEYTMTSSTVYILQAHKTRIVSIDSRVSFSLLFSQLNELSIYSVHKYVHFWPTIST